MHTRFLFLATFMLQSCGSSDPGSPHSPGPASSAPHAAEGGVEVTPGAEAPSANTPAPFVRVDPAGFEVTEGEGVIISGTISCEGDEVPAGTLRLDVIRQRATKDEADESLPLVYSQSLEGPGPFQVQLPANYGNISMMIYFDPDMNGPSPRDIGFVTNTIQVGGADITGLSYVLNQAFPDVPPEGEFTVPGNKPGEAAPTPAGAPVGAAPTD